MKLKDLIPKLQALNPEAEVYAWDPHEELTLLERILGAEQSSRGPWCKFKDATPSDTLIVLSE